MPKIVLRKQKEPDIQEIREIVKQGIDYTGVKPHDARNGTFSVLGALLLIALFLTLNEFVFRFDNLPSWTSIFTKTNNYNNSYVVQSGNIQVHFIDVGQGDCELILTENKAVLIDSGEREYAGNVKQYLDDLGVSKLDYIICSHPHSDHIGSMSVIVDEFSVDNIFFPKIKNNLNPESNSLNLLLESCSSKNIKPEYIKSDTEITLEDDCYIDVIAPVGSYDNLNNYSLVLKLYFREKSFLFTGDIEVSAEYDISEKEYDLSADVIKVPHHGSSTSSSYRFLKLVRPDFAVIEVGADNDYNHPVASVIERYEKLGAAIYRTDLHGNIVFYCDGNTVSIKTNN